jgi:hypothetical protein
MADTHILEPRRAEAVRRSVAVEEAPVREYEGLKRAVYSAYKVLHIGFVVAPILAGVDKFFHFLVNWDMYLAPRVERLLPVSGHTFMLIVGVIEVAAGLLVAVAPRIGGFVVAAWLWGIIGNLLLFPGYYDIALRDFGLSLGALALGILARARIHPSKRTVAPETGTPATESR